MNQEERLSILKDILLTDEREYAAKVEEKLKIVEEIINKQKKLSERVNPIIDEKIDNFVVEIPKTLGPAITEALKTEIKNPIIEQIMVIEKGSGLVISEYTKTQNIDQDMVGGMLTAIKSFAEDAFEKGNQELQYIEYNSFHIHLQNFSSYYIAVVISGPFNVIFKDKLEDKLLDFAQNYVNKEDLNDQPAFTRKLKSYFGNENF